MNKTQMIKRAYVRGLAARGIYRARLRQKQAAGGLKGYAISGGIGAAGGGALGSLIGALVQYARGKNVLQGALAGGGIGGGLGLLGGLGYQYAKGPDRNAPIIVKTKHGPVSLVDPGTGGPASVNSMTDYFATMQELGRPISADDIKADIPLNHNLKRDWGATARNKIRSSIKNTGSALSDILSGSANSAKSGLDSLLNAINPKNWMRGGSPAQNAVDNAVDWAEMQEAGRDDPFYAWAVGEEEKEKTNRMNEQAKKNYKDSFEYKEQQRAGRDDPFYSYGVEQEEKEKTNRMNEQAKKNYKGSFEDKQNRSKQQKKIDKSEWARRVANDIGSKIAQGLPVTREERDAYADARRVYKEVMGYDL